MRLTGVMPFLDGLRRKPGRLKSVNFLLIGASEVSPTASGAVYPKKPNFGSQACSIDSAMISVRRVSRSKAVLPIL